MSQRIFPLEYSSGNKESKSILLEINSFKSTSWIAHQSLTTGTESVAGSIFNMCDTLHSTPSRKEKVKRYSSFLSCCNKIPCNLEEKGSILAHNSIIAGKSRQQELGAASHTHNREQRQRTQVCIHTHCSASFLLNVQEPDPRSGAAYPLGLPTSINIIKSQPPPHSLLETSPRWF